MQTTEINTHIETLAHRHSHTHTETCTHTYIVSSLVTTVGKIFNTHIETLAHTHRHSHTHILKHAHIHTLFLHWSPLLAKFSSLLQAMKYLQKREKRDGKFRSYTYINM